MMRQTLILGCTIDGKTFSHSLSNKDLRKCTVRILCTKRSYNILSGSQMYEFIFILIIAIPTINQLLSQFKEPITITCKQL